MGEARLWGGVHWLSDPVAGQKIGRATAQAVIVELQRQSIEPFNPMPPPTEPPLPASLDPSTPP